MLKSLAFDFVPPQCIWWSLRLKGVPEAYIDILRDCCRNSDCRNSRPSYNGNEDAANIDRLCNFFIGTDLPDV